MRVISTCSPHLHLVILFGALFASLQTSSLYAQSQRFLYVANWDASSNSISGFSVDTATGLLTPLPGFPIPADGHPHQFAVHPNNKFLYVANESGFSVSAYSLNPSTGSLTAIVGSPFPAGPGSTWVIVDPSGRFAYANSYSSNSVFGFTINTASGVLTPMAGSPFPAQGVTGRDEPGPLAMDPTGKFLFTPNYRSNTLTVYSIDAVTGALTFVPGSPFTTGNTPQAGTTDPIGRFFYLADAYSNDISAYAINGVTGALTPVPGSPFPTGMYTALAQGYPTTVAVDRNGQFAYATNEVGNSIAIYGIDPISGALSPILGSPFPAGTASGPTAFTFSPDGALAYVANQQGGSISVYSINSTTGALTPIPNGTFPTGTQPIAIAVVNGGAPPAVTPNHGGNVGTVTVTVFGQFSPTAPTSATLHAVGQADIFGSSPIVDPVPRQNAIRRRECL